jgi:hypothetical protein
MPDNDRQPVDLVDAGVPADQGLSSLGLLMQLVGSVLAGYAALLAFVVLFSMEARGRGGAGADTLWIFLIIGVSITRSLFHRSAGSQLLYGNPADSGGRLAGIRRYIMFSFIQSALVAVIVIAKWKLDTSLALGIAAGLAAWPAALAIILAMPRFRRYKDDLPITEDKGFEGASILMTVLGLCGLLGMSTLLIMLLDLPGKILQQGPGILIVLSVGMLVARSVIHVQAGLSGLRETSVDRSVELANRYANFGMISSFCAAGALLLFVMQARLDLMGLAVISSICWMLMAWPLVIRRFFSDRQFVELLAGDDAPLHRRAPDAGLTSLGWLLVAHAVFGISLLLPQLFASGGFRGGEAIMALAGAAGIRSIWWTVVLVTLQCWAGYELIRMSPQSRSIATVFGVAGAALNLYISWPVFQMMTGHRGDFISSAPMLGPIAINLVIPIATLVLVNRKIAPTARARFRAKPVAPTTESPPEAPKS